MQTGAQPETGSGPEPGTPAEPGAPRPAAGGAAAPDPPLGHWLVDPRLTPKPPDRRRDILDAALRLFNDGGYVRTSIQDIALGAEASVGSIYHHFGGKEEIATALYVEGLAEYQRGLMAVLADDEGGAERTVRAIVAHHLRWVEDNTDLARFLLTSRDPAVTGLSERGLSGMNQRLFELVERWIARSADAGEIRRIPLTLFHAVVLGPSQEFARHWLAERTRTSIEEAEPVLADAAWKAVRA